MNERLSVIGYRLPVASSEQRTDNRERRTRGFTLVELLVVIAIIAILAAILLPAMNAAIRKGEEAQGQSEVKSIETAVKAYVNEYSKFPHQSGAASDLSYGDPSLSSGLYSNNVALINVLRSVDGPGNQNYGCNTRKIIFLEVSESSLSAGSMIDPWGNQYQVTVDTDFDNICEVTISGFSTNIPGRNVVVFSRGVDGALNTKDDIKSWK